MPSKNPLILLFIGLCSLILQPIQAQISYFPPLTGNDWAMQSFQNFPYDTDYTDSLHAYLEAKGSKAFLVLHDGKIVDEKYFGTFTQDSFWYWASAGKSLTSFLMGQAVDQGLIRVDDKVSDHVGMAWTSCTPEQENKILVKHLLSLSTGLNGQVPDGDCTDPSCFQYKGDAGTLWYYHNATYYMNHEVLEAASGKTLQNFTTTNLSLKSGISGLWLNHVFFSKPRSAARFGLLMLNQGVWDGDSLLKSRDYFNSMTTPSQTMNPAYGRLFWLNGQDTIMIPQSTLRLPLTLNEEAPADMYCALGKNDQKIYLVPSQKLVIVRMGDDPGDGLLGPSSFDTELWRHINRWRQVPNGLENTNSAGSIYPNPCSHYLNLENEPDAVELFQINGSKVPVLRDGKRIDVSDLPNGIYFLQLTAGEKVSRYKIIVAH